MPELKVSPQLTSLVSTLQLTLPPAVGEAAAAREWVGRSKLAVTVQLPVMVPVVYVVPDKVPVPQPVEALTLATKFVPGVTVKVVVLPLVTVWVGGVMVPPEPPPVLETVKVGLVGVIEAVVAHLWVTPSFAQRRKE